MKLICADSCFLIALYDSSDQHHETACTAFSDYFGKTRNKLLIPWPAMYETVSTRMVRSLERIQRLDRDWRTLRISGKLEFLDDGPYRETALDDCLGEPVRGQNRYRPLSLVDRVIRGLLSDSKQRINGILTFNAKDFQDICRRGRSEILPSA